jgi:hypothetical protein
VYLCVSISEYFLFTHHHSFWPFVQNGLMPLATKDYKDFPLTRSNGDAPCPRVESFVVAITFIRCFNAALHDPASHIIMNWWNRDNKFVGGMRKVPPYTDLFWNLFFKVAPFLGDLKSEILLVNNERQIDELRHKRLTVFVRNDDNDLVAQEIPLVSPAIRAIVDNIHFVSVYGHKTMWETRTRPAFRASVLAQITKEAKDHEAAFYDSWKDFRRRFPLQAEVPAEEDGLDESIMQEFFDSPTPLAAAEAAAEAAAGSGSDGE